MAEQMEHALDAFGKVTLKRFIGVVPSICWENMNKFPQRLENELMNTPDAYLLKIMADSPSFKRNYDVNTMNWKRKPKSCKKALLF
jgi:hypothetical protein